MWIGCVHPDRLLTYPDVGFLSGCWFPIRMLISRPRGFEGTWLARSASAPGSLVRVCARIVLTAGLSDWLQASVLLRDGLECSTVRVRRARACADNPRHHVWFPNNVARNSLVNISDFENASLELQRLWGVSKTDRVKLRATFGERRVAALRRGAPSGNQRFWASRGMGLAGNDPRARADRAPTSRAPTRPGPGKPATASCRKTRPTPPQRPTRNG